MKSPQIKLSIYSQVNFGKRLRPDICRKDILFNVQCWEGWVDTQLIMGLESCLPLSPFVLALSRIISCPFLVSTLPLIFISLSVFLYRPSTNCFKLFILFIFIVFMPSVTCILEHAFLFSLLTKN